MVELEDFFDFDSNEPINRLAYTEEDMKYKIKVIEKMQELGMTITVDKVGNICGSIAIGNNPEKTLAMGSHTDSVDNGGQYDGPVGVISALQTAENLLKSKKINGIIKVAIYACEESTRFGNACIGSKYLSGHIEEKDLDQIVDGNKITLREAIEQGKSYLMENTKGIQEVEKIFTKEEIDYSLESHIEQYQTLDERYKKSGKEQIAIINCVGSAVRVEYDVQGEAAHTGSTPMKERKNPFDAVCFIGRKVYKLGKKYEKQGLGRASQVGGGTINDDRGYNQIKEQAEARIDFRLFGENTPEKVLEDFEKIVKKVENKTRTKVNARVISKGTPAITSQELNAVIAKVCDQNQIEYIEKLSEAGQDTGYIPAKQKTMIFIPSTGGSHNKNEKTKKKHIETATKVLTATAQELLKERFKESYKCEVEGIATIGKEQSTDEKIYTNQSQQGERDLS